LPLYLFFYFFIFLFVVEPESTHIMGQVFGSGQVSRLKRKPTHRKCVTKDHQLTLGYEIFQFRGGRPPERGFHFSEDDELEIPAAANWEILCRCLKVHLDPNNGYNLSFFIYTRNGKEGQTIYSEDEGRGTDKNYPEEITVLDAFINKNYTLRVYRPFGRGKKDIGTFEPVLEMNHADKPEEKQIISLKNKESFTVEEIGTLRAHFGLMDESCFKVFEKPVELKEDHLNELQKYADKIYAEKKKQEKDNESSSSLKDLQIPLSRSQVNKFIGKDALTALDNIFGEASNDIVLRRCDYLNHCIDFHVDYAYKTLQVALNDDSEYEGGRLVFVSNGKLEMPKRKSGTITLHERNIIHGVTALRSGVRYGLLILNHPLSM
jgi:hypothetical protein